MAQTPIALKRALAVHRQRLLQTYRQHGLVGVGISEKMSKGRKTGRFALTLYVEKKKDPGQLTTAQRVDLDSALITAVGADQIDVKEIGHVKALGTDRVRPVVTGCSEGHFRITAGTGSVLVQLDNGKIGRLSNNHVYADVNHAKLGDPIYQPGPYDGGTADDTVGTLERFHPIDFVGVNQVDCAVRTTMPDERTELFDLGASPVRTVAAEVGQRVVKSGRTTGVTYGEITDVNLSVVVDYGADGDVTYEEQILVEATTPFSQGGDSGSGVMVTGAELQWVGLLFAGDETGRTTICNHATVVETTLGVTLLPGSGGGGGGEPPPTEPPKFPWWVLVIIALLALFGIIYFTQQ